MKVIEEKNGIKLGINDNPDVAHLEEFQRYQVENELGERFSGNEKSIRRLFEKLSQ